MNNYTPRLFLASIVVAGSLWALGCGGNGAANNDQGTSVSLLGFYPPTGAAGDGGGEEDGCAVRTVGISGAQLRLGQASTEPSSSTDGSLVGSSALVASVGIQNNLAGQTFRGDRLLLEYYIPGSNLQPPSTNVAVNIFTGPGPVGVGGGAAGGASGASGAQPTGNLRRPAVTSLPPSFGDICNRSYSAVWIVPAPIREWLNFNREALPEPPYAMEVYATVTGLSSSGNRYDTNTAALQIDILPEVIVSGDEDTTDTTTTGSSFTPDDSETSEPGSDDSSDVSTGDGTL